jgi:lipopolysaccharide export system protein LptC
VVSQEPVTVSLGNGVIQATGVEVKENGKVLSFKGRVQTTFEGASSPPPSSRSTPLAGSAAPAPELSAQPSGFRR